jgi:serine/threonine-protein kinase
MNPDWERQKALFLAALEAGRSERQQLLAEAPSSDRVEVESLLSAHGVVDTVVHTGLLESITGSAQKGRRLGSWTLDLPLGLGPLGHTFRAHDPAGRAAVLQVIEGDGDRQKLTAALEPVARRLLELDHPGLAHVLDVGHQHGTLWVASEALGGLAIDRGCDAEHASLTRRAALLLELAHALEALHRHGILHRDLSTRTARLVDGRVRLGDFGVAGLISDALPRATTASAAPELGHGPPTVASDLFAFGTVAAAVLLGCTPAPGSAPSQALAALDPEARATIAHNRQLQPDDLETALRAFDPLLSTCLDPDPARRPDSAAQAAALLRRR